MNESMPPQIPRTPAVITATVPLGEHPEDRLPIAGISAAMEAILRQPRRVMFQLRQSASSRLIAAMVLLALLCGLVYGLVVGTFSGAEQLWAAPVKIACGMLVCAAICLPSLYIFSCLSGSQARLVEVIGLIAGLLLLMTLLLIGFAPVAWVFSQSTESVVAMGALHIVFWFIAAYFGLRFLTAGFRHLSAQSNAGLNVWIVLFVLVCLQMTTAVRPLVGKAETFLPKEKKFFLAHWIHSFEAPSIKKANTQASR
jgi:hypothetical protein